MRKQQESICFTKQSGNYLPREKKHSAFENIAEYTYIQDAF